MVRIVGDQLIDGGSNPTSPLCFEIDYARAKEFVVQFHYSGTCPPGLHYFGLFERGRVIEQNTELVGVAVFGYPTGRRQIQRHGNVIELTRLCLTDEMPKNSESFFIGYCLRWLKKNTSFAGVLSLADTYQGHTGIIYQATNFVKVDVSKPGNGQFFIDGIETHPRTLYNRHGTSTREVIKKIYGDRLVIKKRCPKIVYLYDFKRKELG